MTDRRAELGDFLRRRRSALTPAMVDIPATQRRRTPGLRREEVAELAGVSTALYTWLEQGRDVPVSTRSIDAITAALQCDPVERDHVRVLARGGTVVRQERVAPSLRRLANSLTTHPVVIINSRWDIVLCNRAAKSVIFSLVDEPAHENLLRLTFGARGRALNLDWETVAQSVVEIFRFDLGYYDHDEDAFALVKDLRANDSDFARLWDAHGVRRAPRALRRFRHPTGAVLTFDPLLLAVIDAPGLRSLVFTPVDDETKRGVDRLVHEARASRDA